MSPKPMDWVVPPAVYDLTTAPYILDPGLAAGVGDGVILPLTAHRDIEDNLSTAFPQLEQTAVRVRGNIRFGFVPWVTPESPPSGNCIIHMHFRIIVTVQMFGTQAPEDPGYTMKDAVRANDDFLWETIKTTAYRSTWWTSTSVWVNWQRAQEIPVDVTVSRRLKQREVLGLAVWAHEVANGVDNISATTALNIWFDPNLRTLVRTIT